MDRKACFQIDDPGSGKALGTPRACLCDTILDVIPAVFVGILVFGSVLFSSSIVAAEDAPVTRHRPFLRGDSNGDGSISIADILTLIRYFHDEGYPAPCFDAADFDDSGELNLTDVMRLVVFIFFNGTVPPAPYPDLGFDTTPDPLDCVSGSRLFDGQGGGADRDYGQEVDFVHFSNRVVQGYPGQEDLYLPVRIRTTDEVDGFTLSVFSDPLQIQLREFAYEDTRLEVHNPEWKVHYSHRLKEGYLAYSVFMDFTPPFEGKVLPRSDESITISFLVLTISPDAVPGDTFRVEFTTTPPPDDMHPPLLNEFSVRGMSTFPTLDAKGVTIQVVERERLFVRGDSNRDGILDITDVILILRFLFADEVVECLDPLDSDGDGVLRVTDAIHLAGFLYLGGSPPPGPFPNPGLDPLPDDLGDCGAGESLTEETED